MATLNLLCGSVTQGVFGCEYSSPGFSATVQIACSIN